ncbi:hypothetical protein JKP88DRAFT_252420 [Tribonema minus]|uniref:Uncharacterized protein n=1 Tax=Tribonema minus TaxID=303371 RepID=A0A836CLY9_9STRA|nr:hypothetical protein JKP88DRAFT_252420 [Tribonema minus]
MLLRLTDVLDGGSDSSHGDRKRQPIRAVQVHVRQTEGCTGQSATWYIITCVSYFYDASIPIVAGAESRTGKPQNVQTPHPWALHHAQEAANQDSERGHFLAVLYIWFVLQNLQMVPNLKNAKHSISFARYEEEYQCTWKRAQRGFTLTGEDKFVQPFPAFQASTALPATYWQVMLGLHHTPGAVFSAAGMPQRPHVRTCQGRSSSARVAGDSSALGEPSVSNLHSENDELNETRAPALATTGSNGGSPDHRVHMIQQRPRPAIAERHGGVRQVDLTSGGQFRPAQHTRPATGVRRGTGYMHQFDKISIKDAFEGSCQTASYTSASNQRAVRPASSPSKGAHHQAMRVVVAASHSGYTHTLLATVELNMMRVTGMPHETNSTLQKLPSPRSRGRLASHAGSGVSKVVITLSSVSGLARGEGSVAKTLRGFVLRARAAAPIKLFGQLEIPMEELQPWLRWHLRNFGGAQIPEHIQACVLVNADPGLQPQQFATGCMLMQCAICITCELDQPLVLICSTKWCSLLPALAEGPPYCAAAYLHISFVATLTQILTVVPKAPHLQLITYIVCTLQELQQLVAARFIDSLGNYPDMLASFSAAARKQVNLNPCKCHVQSAQHRAVDCGHRSAKAMPHEIDELLLVHSTMYIPKVQMALTAYAFMESIAGTLLVHRLNILCAFTKQMTKGVAMLAC